MSAMTIQIKDLKEQIGAMTESHAAALADLTQERDALAAYKAETEPKIAELTSQIEAATKTADELTAKAAELAEQIAALEAEKAAALDELNKAKAALELAPEGADVKPGSPVNAGTADSEITLETLAKLSGTERVKAFKLFSKKPA